MKKLFNSKFLFILASSLVVLILLTVGAFYLFDDKDDVFVKSGYVLNPLSSTSEKYFFGENTGYKENLSSMIEFVDVDEKTVSVLKDSFLHYDDESISFLKRGALLDLDTLKSNKAVSFYNITKESIIEKKDSGYFIESSAGDVRLVNFMGRISDNKYIVVGDLSLKLAGNDTAIKGEYFEIVYIEEGIVNIENKNVKYQVTADGTLIHVGNDKVIDLGDKKITVNDVDLMSITSITIDGDENIEIIPKGNDEEEDEPSGSEGEGDNQQGTPGENQQPGNEGESGSGEGKPDGEAPEEVVISLKNAKTGSTNIDVVFDVVNAKEDDVFKLQVVNLSSGRTVDIVAEVLSDVEIKVNLLSPSTKYLFMVVNEKDNGKYFQKVLETTGFGIKLEKTFATESSLSYKVTIEEGTDITNAKLTLYKFNEETNQNEVVTDSYVDSVTGEVVTVEKIVNLSSFKENLEGEHEIVYEGLESNMIYTAVLDEFSVASSNFKDVYNITLTSMTLKQVPKFSEMTVTKDVGAGSFDLSLGNITDPDNAIVGYTYVIYDKMDDSVAVEPIFQNNASPITVKIGTEDNELRNDTNYYYKAIIEYFDNEKYIEYITTDSIIFMMGNDPYITVVPDETRIAHDKLGATIYLTDNSCLVSMPGRKKCGGASTTVVEVSRINPLTGERTPVFNKLVEFEVTDDEIKYDLFVEDLQPGTTYNIEVRASLNNSNDALVKTDLLHTNESKRTITTKSLSTFEVDWKTVKGNDKDVVNATLQLIGDENSGALSPEETLNAVNKVILKFYEGKNNGDLATKIPIGEKVIAKNILIDFKALLYDTIYPVGSETTFKLTKEQLKKMSNTGDLNEYYTISIEAYTESNYRINLVKNIYVHKVERSLFDITEVVDVELTPISHSNTNRMFGKYIFPNLKNGATTVGYTVEAEFTRELYENQHFIPEKVHFYVYNDKGEKLKFYILNENNELELVEKVTGVLGENDGSYLTEIYMDYGTSYETTDDVLRRGNQFLIGYEIEAYDEQDKTNVFLPVGDYNSPTGIGCYKSAFVAKETPNTKMYIASSDATSITYAYTVDDPDNAVYKELDSENYSFYYSINEGVPVKYDMVKVDDGSYNKFEGRMKIDGLRSGYLYKMYYRQNLNKTGDFVKDVSDVSVGSTDGVSMFDGFYDAKENLQLYNFRYKIINNAEMDNKVVIKIMASENILSRIVSYELTFKDSKGSKPLTKSLWQLSHCDGDGENSVPRCLTVDYTELKEAGMKSENNETNMISVDVKAYYDNGLTGFDFKVGGDNPDYEYCILQNNSSALGFGNYIAFSSSGDVTVWNEDLGVAKGYYTYSLAFIKGVPTIGYIPYHSSASAKSFGAPLNAAGYESKYGFVNPKMISVDEMACTGKEGDGCNKFSFSSITPKVSVTEKSATINGNVLDFRLSGIDIGDIKEEDGQRYLYVEVWDNYSNAGMMDKVVRPVVKVKINSSKPTATVSKAIDGLQDNKTYFYNVYAYMNKGGKYLYTQLFDAGISSRYEVKTYEFKTATAKDLFHSLNVNYTSSEKIYGNRELNTKINLLAYKKGVAFNFDIVYVLCSEFVLDEDGKPIVNAKGEYERNLNCGMKVDGGDNIFEKVVPLSSINSTVIDDLVDISDYDLEYGANYYLNIYARVDYYNTPTEIVKRNVLLNRYDSYITLRKLNEPSFSVTRNAGSINDDYYIDFNVVVNDPDRTLVDGKYFIKLIDGDPNKDNDGYKCGAPVMQLKGSDGVYFDVDDDYEFDAFTISKSVRMRCLKPDHKYIIVVYNDAYIKNYGVDYNDYEGDSNGKYTLATGKIVDASNVKKATTQYTSYTTNKSGVALGKEVQFNLTQDSVILTFLGGSNFDNVLEVEYTAGIWGTEEQNTFSGLYVIGEDNKYFEYNKESDDWIFVITPNGMYNDTASKYSMVVKFKVKDSTNETGYRWYTVEGTAVYKK